MFFDCFIDVLNSELNKKNHASIAKPHSLEERVISIQDSSSALAASFTGDIEGVQRIIPVTLTPEKAESG